MKKQISILLAAILFSSCAMQDKGGVGPNANAENDKVMSVENAETGDVSKIYEGYEELQGKQVGEHIIMPEVITPQEIENVYTYRVEDNYDKSNLMERGTAFYKRFFGDDFNADRLYLYEYEDDEELNKLSYNSNGDVPEGVYDPENDSYFGSYSGFPSGATKTNAWFKYAEEQVVIAEYDPVRDKDVKMELEGGNCTVGEISETVLSFFDREMIGFEGLKPRILSIYYYTDIEDNNTVRLACADCTFDKEGIPALNRVTPYWEEKQLAGGYQATYYTPLYYQVTLGGKDNILAFQTTGIGPQKATEVKKIENVISLRSAAELLDKNLAEKLVFKINKVCLYYCQKITSFYYENERELPYSQKTPDIEYDYRPTWIFEFSDGAGSLKVDAITGEITIDATVDILNEMRRQQGN